MMRARRVAVMLGALALANAAAAGLASGAKHPSPKDSFSGSITTATKHFAGDHGSLSAYIAAPDSGQTVRHITLTLLGRDCGHAKHCLKLSAKLSGTLTREPPKIPDVGSSEKLTAAGSVTPLGQTIINGTVHGTGMLGSGRETMELTLALKNGTLTIKARSAVVPGFTSP